MPKNKKGSLQVKGNLGAIEMESIVSTVKDKGKK